MFDSKYTGIDYTVRPVGLAASGGKFLEPDIADLCLVEAFRVSGVLVKSLDRALLLGNSLTSLVKCCPAHAASMYVLKCSAVSWMWIWI